MTKEHLFSLLAEYGGSIISSNDLSPEWVAQARASGRMYVDENSLGYIWEPPISKLPETVEEVELFNRWFPIKIELPPGLRNFNEFMGRVKKIKLEEKQRKNN